MASTITNFKKSKNRKNKIELVFDPKDRREFLTGFRKRKQQKKKAAQEKLEQALKDERKRLKKEARETFKKLVGTHRPLPILENLFSKEYEEDDVTVKVTELSTADIADRNNWIGENKPVYENEVESNENSDKESDEEILGMEIKRRNEEKNVTVNAPVFSSKKEIKKTLMRQATIKMQKSKAFQLKNRIEQQKSKNKSKRMKREKKKKEKRMNKNRGKK